MFMESQVIDTIQKNKKGAKTFIALFLTIPTLTQKNAVTKPFGKSIHGGDSMNLDWLDLTMNFNRSFCEINCDFGHGNVHEYFNCTTKPSVDLLFVHSSQAPVSPGCIPQPYRKFKPRIPTPKSTTPKSTSTIPRTEIITFNKKDTKSFEKLSEQTKKAAKKEIHQTTYLRMVLTNKDGSPYPHKNYILEADGVDYFGETDERGLVEQVVPDSIKKGKITLLMDEENPVRRIEWDLEIA